MATLSGALLPSNLANTDRDGLGAEITPALDALSFTPVSDVTRVNYTPPLYQGVQVSNLPVEQREASLLGRKGPSFFDDFYNRIHARPPLLPLGSVVSTQVTPVYIWNAYLVNRSLSSILGETEGIDLQGQPSPPLLYKPLQELVYQLAVSTDGPPVIDDRLSWVFDNGDFAEMRITGIRVSSWWVRADWSYPVTERLEWFTSVAKSPYGVEQRRSLRLAPRRTFRLKSIANRKQRRYLELLIAEAGGRNWAVPVWPQTQFSAGPITSGALTIYVDTTYYDFAVGGLLMVGGDDPWDFEVLEIKTIQPTYVTLARPTTKPWPSGTRIVPGKISRMKEQVMMHRLTDEAVSMEVYFEQVEVADWPAIMPADTYLSKPVYYARPEESEDLTNQAQRLLAMVETNTGIPRVTDTAGHSFKALGHRWQVYGRQAQASLRSFFYALGGKWKSVWVPTHYNDLQIVANMEATTSYLEIEWCGYTRTGALSNSGTRDIMMTLRDGTRKYFRIMQAEEISNGNERLILNAAAGQPIKVSDVDRISFMNIMRLDQDYIEFSHTTDSSNGMVSTKGVWLSLRDDI